MTTCWMRFQDQAKETSLYHSNQGCTDRKTKMTSVIFYFLMTSISFTFSKFSKISNILSENLIVQFESCSIKFLISWRFKKHFQKIWKFFKFKLMLIDFRKGNWTIQAAACIAFPAFIFFTCNRLIQYIEFVASTCSKIQSAACMLFQLKYFVLAFKLCTWVHFQSANF